MCICENGHGRQIIDRFARISLCYPNLPPLTSTRICSLLVVTLDGVETAHQVQFVLFDLYSVWACRCSVLYCMVTPTSRYGWPDGSEEVQIPPGERCEVLSVLVVALFFRRGMRESVSYGKIR